MSFVMTSPAVSKPTDKGVTSNTSHTAPSSSLASPLSSRSSPPQFQVVIRRAPDFSGASVHSTHCCGCGCCCYCSCCDCCCCCCCCCCETWRTRWRVASLLFLFCPVSPLSPFFSLSLSSHRVSPTQFPSRTCSAACLAARQVLRRPLALRMCGPFSTRIHHALCHHVMCLFDTWHSSRTEFTSSSCLPWASTFLSCSVRSS